MAGPLWKQQAVLHGAFAFAIVGCLVAALAVASGVLPTTGPEEQHAS